MKVLSVEQIRNCDQATIQRQGISSLSLMEKAATACTSWITTHFPKNNDFCIFCGNGNNGGDGFAIARQLYLKGADVKIFLDKTKSRFSEDALTNLKKAEAISGIEILDFSDLKNTEIKKSCLLIDAILGTGLKGEVQKKTATVIDLLNKIPAVKISVDLPSGLSPDIMLAENSCAVKADYTLSFQFWKRSFFHPETGKFCGKVVLLNIDLDEDFIKNTSTDFHHTNAELASRIYRPREEFSHKGNYGKACIVGGSFGKTGAAVLATQAALRGGSGLTFVMAPKCGYEILQVSCPEAQYLYGGEDHLNLLAHKEDFTYGIGPGIGTDPETAEELLLFLAKQNKPLVLDADALNILARNPSAIFHLPANSILTPHPKEFERLFGKSENSFERLEVARKKSHELHVYIILKDHHTQICTPDGEVFYNVSGNSGLAKGGSGDVLTGLLTALLAQGYTPRDASLLGVWMHGHAAELASQKISKEALLPSDVIATFSEVFWELALKKSSEF